MTVVREINSDIFAVCGKLYMHVPAFVLVEKFLSWEKDIVVKVEQFLGKRWSVTHHQYSLHYNRQKNPVRVVTGAC